MSQLVLKRASASRPSGAWNDDDFDVLADGAVVGRIGGLLSYGIDQHDQFRRAAGYADRILKGAKPSELRVQGPVKFELVINLKTAKALSLEVPVHLQQRADDVIE